FFFSSRRRHTRSKRDWSSDVCSSDLALLGGSILHKVGFIPLITGGFSLLAIGIGLSLWTFGMDTLWPFIASLLVVGLGSGLATRSEERRVGKGRRTEKLWNATSNRYI